MLTLASLVALTPVLEHAGSVVIGGASGILADEAKDRFQQRRQRIARLSSALPENEDIERHVCLAHFRACRELVRLLRGGQARRARAAVVNPQEVFLARADASFEEAIRCLARQDSNWRAALEGAANAGRPALESALLAYEAGETEEQTLGAALASNAENDIVSRCEAPTEDVKKWIREQLARDDRQYLPIFQLCLGEEIKRGDPAFFRILAIKEQVATRSELHALGETLQDLADTSGALRAEHAQVLDAIKHLATSTSVVEQEIRAYVEGHAARSQPLLTVFPQSGGSGGLLAQGRAVPLLGRDEALARLTTFCDQPPSNNGHFSWLQIAGPGGSGKTRLALELVLDRWYRGWVSGFLLRSEITSFEAQWRNWRPTGNTLIVIDYVLEHAGSVGHIINTLKDWQNEYEHPVRLVLVERQPWRDEESSRENPASHGSGPATLKMTLDDKEARWFSDMNLDRVAKKCRFQPTVVKVEPLNQEELIGLVRQYVLFKGQTTSEPDSAIASTLSRIDREGRPLYAYFIGEALADDRDISEWSKYDLLKDVLKRDRDSRWTSLFGDRPPREGDDRISLRLALLATLLQEIDVDSIAKDAVATQYDWGGVSNQDVDEARALVDAAIYGGMGRPSRRVPGLQPDILGGFFLLTFLPSDRDWESILNDAWKLNPDKTSATLLRVFQDFEDASVAQKLVLNYPTSKGAAKAHGDAIVSATRICIEKEQELGELTRSLQYYSEQGHVRATSVRAYLLYRGFGIAADPAEAARLYRLAAEQGDASAQFNLGVCCQRGIGVDADPAEAARLYRLAAEQGDASAQFNLGVCYQCGIGVDADPAEAARLYRLAAEQGDASAHSNLGVCYERGIGVDADPAEAARLHRLAAEQGDAIAQSNLGVCFERGIGVDADPAEAVRLYRLAAEQGDASAQSNLGLCYQRGIGVDADPAEAVRLYRLAAEQGYASAQFNLGLCYACGIGVDADPAEAVRLWRLAAEQGDASAQFNLGLCYQRGIGVDADPAEAARLWRLAAEQGDAIAQSNLGVCYQRGIGVDADPAEAARLYRLAAEQGDASAQFNLGLCYKRGIGVDADPAEAARLYRLAAEQGDAIAQSNLGLCYERGIGVDADPAEAVRLYRLAAEQGDAIAQSNLGLCYERGIGVDADPAEAVRLYRLAAEQGDAIAQSNLGVCFERGIGVDADPAEAARLYRLAAEQGDAIAQSNLGVCFERGIGVDADPAEAVRLYRLAAEQGHVKAQFNLGLCYQRGIGVDADPAEAARLWRLAAEQGDASAQSNLGVCFERGIGVDADPAEAVRLYRLAAEQGHVKAQFNLGLSYERGTGVDADPAEAVRLWRLAAEQGLTEAIEKLTGENPSDGAD